MNLPPDYLTRPHVVFDVESFGLHGQSFAVGAVLVRFELADRHDRDEITPNGKVTMHTVNAMAATDYKADRPWTLLNGQAILTRIDRGTLPKYPNRTVPSSKGTFDWLNANIPDSVFEPARLTVDLSIFKLFDTFVQAAGPDVMLWAECPVPVEANFLNELRRALPGVRDGFWESIRAPLLRDIASLADPLGVPDERVDMHKPAHDPLNDARASARRLVMALSKIVRSA